MNKVLFFFCGVLLTTPLLFSCSSSDDSGTGNFSQETIQASFKLNVPPTTEATINHVRLLAATATEACFYTLYDNFLLDVRKVSVEGSVGVLVEAEQFKDFDLKDVAIEDRLTLDKQGNVYTIMTNKKEPNRKTIWKFDQVTKQVVPFVHVQHGDLKFISYWPAQNKLLIQDENKIYTLGLNEQEDKLEFFIGGPNGSSSQPKDGSGAEASVRLRFPISYVDQDFFILERDRFLRKVFYDQDERKSQVKTISVFESGSFAYLTMTDANHFFIDRKNPEVGLSEGTFDSQVIKSHFFVKNAFYGFPIVYKGQAEQEMLVSTAMYVILGGEKNGVKLYTMNSYLPVANDMWSASKKSIVYIKDFTSQINHTKRIKL